MTTYEAETREYSCIPCVFRRRVDRSAGVESTVRRDVRARDRTRARIVRSVDRSIDRARPSRDRTDGRTDDAFAFALARASTNTLLKELSGS